MAIPGYTKDRVRRGVFASGQLKHEKEIEVKKYDEQRSFIAGA
jgi:hypothetical protein